MEGQILLKCFTNCYEKISLFENEPMEELKFYLEGACLTAGIHFLPAFGDVPWPKIKIAEDAQAEVPSRALIPSPVIFKLTG